MAKAVGEEFFIEGELRGILEPATDPENDSSRKSMTCGYLLNEGDGTRTRNHRIDRQLENPAEKYRNP